MKNKYLVSSVMLFGLSYGVAMAQPVISVTQLSSTVVSPNTPVKYRVSISNWQTSSSSIEDYLQVMLYTQDTGALTLEDVSVESLTNCASNLSGDMGTYVACAVVGSSAVIDISVIFPDGVVKYPVINVGSAQTGQLSYPMDGVAVGSESYNFNYYSNYSANNKAGDTITFTHQVTNTGTLSLGAVTLYGTVGSNVVTNNTSASTLAAGQAYTYQSTYQLTQADINAGGPQYVAQASVRSNYTGTTVGSAINPVISSSSNTETTQMAMNAACDGATDVALQSQCTNLASLSSSQKTVAYQQLAPDQVAAQGTTAIVTTTTQVSNVQTRMNEIRQGGGGNGRVSFKGLNLALNGQDLPISRVADDVVDNFILNTGKLGVFVNGRIELGGADTTSKTAGVDFSTKGITLGADYRVSSQFVVGAAVGYNNTDNDFAGNRGNMQTDGSSFSAFATYYNQRNFYLDMMATYSQNHYDSDRHIVYTGVDTHALGSTKSTQWGGSASAGMDFQKNDWLISPYARVEYNESKIKAYTESNNAGLAYAYDDQKIISFTTALATRVSKTISASNGVYVPGAYIEWEHQYKNSERPIVARFVADPTTVFSISTENPDRNYFRVGGSVAATWSNGRSGFAAVETVQGQDNNWYRRLQLGFKKEF